MKVVDADRINEFLGYWEKQIPFPASTELRQMMIESFEVRSPEEIKRARKEFKAIMNNPGDPYVGAIAKQFYELCLWFQDKSQKRWSFDPPSDKEEKEEKP